MEIWEKEKNKKDVYFLEQKKKEDEKRGKELKIKGVGEDKDSF